MDFQSATDRVAGCVTHEELAEALGLSPQTIRVARLSPDSPNYRKPPEGWERALAKLARKRGGELVKLAEQLEQEG
jgi:hypothetical protein